MALHNKDKIKLCTGALMPKIGLGTWKVSIITFEEFNTPKIKILKQFLQFTFITYSFYIYQGTTGKNKGGCKGGNQDRISNDRLRK